MEHNTDFEKNERFMGIIYYVYVCRYVCIIFKLGELSMIYWFVKNKVQN